MRLLGVDFGSRKIGLAVCDSQTGLPTALRFLVASGTLAKDAIAICRIANEQIAEKVILGLPVDLDGETKMSKVVRLLGSKIEEVGLPVEYENESMTSQIAETRMKEQGMKGSEIRKRVDSEAACQILERYLGRHE